MFEVPSCASARALLVPIRLPVGVSELRSGLEAIVKGVRCASLCVESSEKSVTKAFKEETNLFRDYIHTPQLYPVHQLLP